jgi:hypothetical protein
MYAKNNNLNFSINTENWLFKYEKGWEDYLEPCLINTNPQINIIYHTKVNIVLEHYSLKEYKDIIPHIYRLNPIIKSKIHTIKTKYTLHDGNYASIFIRRGDKLLSESRYYPSEQYLSKLVELWPDCKTIFLQTDDYSSFIDLQEVISRKKLDITLITLCDPNLRGIIVFDYFKNILIKDDVNTIKEENKEYMKTVIDSLKKNKSVEEMNRTEIYEHMNTMLVGIDIVLSSKICICDYESNVGRFIKLAHPHFNNVHDINNTHVDLDKIICPAYNF